MMSEALAELGLFLLPSSRLDLKAVALQHLLGLSGSEDGLTALLENQDLILKVVELTRDKSESVAKDALLLLVNISANAAGARLMLQIKSEQYANILLLLVKFILNPEQKDVEAACMILCNITRQEDELESCITTLLPHLNDLLKAFVNPQFNKTGSKLHYIAPLFSNLSRGHRVRKWLTDENPHIPFLKILPFCSYQESLIRRGGAVGTVKNVCFAVELHEWLLSPDIDFLTYILGPLMGNEDYDDDEMDKLPITLQYLPKEKEREADSDIRRMLLETLNRLCTKRSCRQILRDCGVYYVLREYHKWEKDGRALLACENVVDILIREEQEIGVEDITSVEVPGEWTDKFVKMDEDFVKNT